MKLILSPIASDYDTIVTVDGLIVTVDGISYDLSEIPEGGAGYPYDESPFEGVVTREEVIVKFYYDLSKALSHQSDDVDDYTFINPQGKIPSPIKYK